MEYLYLENKSKEAVDCAKQNKAVVLTCIDGYKTMQEALILLDFLWYAREKGVEVTFVSKKEESQK